MTSEHQYISRKDEGDKVVIFERGGLVFVFNFHWSNSYSDYRVGCLKAGKYKVCSSIAFSISFELFYVLSTQLSKALIQLNYLSPIHSDLQDSCL